jgi:rieske iron-sulfur protein
VLYKEASGWGVDAERMQDSIDAFMKTKTQVPQGGVVWVFAVQEEGKVMYARRSVLKGTLSLGLMLPWLPVAAAQDSDPRQARPQEGDRFVFPPGSRAGQLITPADLPLGGPPLLAYPMDAQTAVVRDGSRLNQVLLLRLDPATLAEETRARSAEGIVAFSAVCTHAGCDVTLWQDEVQRFKCPCHDSEFDPKEGAHVLGGPAPRRLPMLPVKIVDGTLIAAGGFTSRPGFQQGGG